MTQNEALLHASNRAAHKVAGAAREWREAIDAIPAVGGFSYARVDAAQVAIYNALDEYEEVERRAQREEA